MGHGPGVAYGSSLASYGSSPREEHKRSPNTPRRGRDLNRSPTIARYWRKQLTGSAAAAIMGTAYPDLFDAVGVHSGLACGSATDTPSAFAAMRVGARSDLTRRSGVRTIVFHGDRDLTVNSVNGDQVIAQSKSMANLQVSVCQGQSPGGARYSRTVHTNGSGDEVLEHWVVHGLGHAWSGGSPAGSYTDARGPDASREMVRFFFSRPAG